MSLVPSRKINKKIELERKKEREAEELRQAKKPEQGHRVISARKHFYFIFENFFDILQIFLIFSKFCTFLLQLRKFNWKMCDPTKFKS